MLLITEIEIENFRSIAQNSFQISSGFLPIVGENNSGKSNILRAMNLFFTGNVEPGQGLDLRRDFHNPGRKHRKEITCSVGFSLPGEFNFHKSIREGLERLVGRNCTIRKVWRHPGQDLPDSSGLTIEVNREGAGFKPVSADDVLKIQQFLNLIRFRYQPNHIHPSEVLKSEESELQRALLFRLRRKIKSEMFEDIFARLKSVAGELVGPISDSLRAAKGQIEELELSTPQEFGELLFTFSPKLQVRGGEKFDALQHGSGVQSYLTYLMLGFLDTRFDMQFGWQQATVWALEEPESFLHQSLQHELADFLKERSEDARFQVFCTTHSDVFARYSGTGALCRLANGRTEIMVKPSRVLVGEAARDGITPYVHPLLFFNSRPVLLVEGPGDRRYINLAYRVLKRLNPWVVFDIPSLDPELQLQGVDGLRSYLQANRGALRTRPLDSPVFVVVDWNESKKSLKGLRAEVERHTTSKLVQWSLEEVNPDLSRSFRGIERALSTELIREADSRGILTALRPAEGELPLSLDRDSLDKESLLSLAEARASEDDLAYFLPFLRRLEELLREQVEVAERAISGELFPVEAAEGPGIK